MANEVHGEPATRNVAMAWRYTQEQAAFVHMGKDKARFTAMNCS